MSKNKDPEILYVHVEGFRTHHAALASKDFIRRVVDADAYDQLRARVAELEATEKVYWMNREAIGQLKETNAALIAKVESLEAALRTLRNEVRGTLSAHELAIRYDHGNSNWACLEMAIADAEKLIGVDQYARERKGEE